MTKRTKNYFDRTLKQRHPIVSLQVPRDLLKDLHPAARAHDSNVNRLVIDLLRVFAKEPQLVRAVFDEN